MADAASKRELLHQLLEFGSVFLHLDPRRAGVVVPGWLAVKPQLVLQLGLNFAIPIPDLEIDDEGVQCTLSFNRAPFHCVLPWDAIYALVAEDGQVNVWHEDLPLELVPQASPAVRRDAPSPRGGRSRRPKPKISLVPSGMDDAVTLSGPIPTVTPPRIDSLPPEPEAAAPEEAPPTPGSSRADRANDSLSMRPPPSADEARPSTAPKKRELPPYLRVVK
jgi:stringent starvation protein B